MKAPVSFVPHLSTEPIRERRYPPPEHLRDYIFEQNGFNNHTFDALDHLEEVLKNLSHEKRLHPLRMYLQPEDKPSLITVGY